MKISIIIVLFLLGHIIGDFYLQWDKLAEDKSKSKGRFALHSSLYAISVGAVLFFTVNWSLALLWVVLIAAGSHTLIDGFRVFIERLSNKSDENDKEPLRYVFLIDQLLHFLVIILLWFTWGHALTERGWVTDLSVDFLSVHPFTALLGLLCVIVPIGCLIGSGDIWDLKKMQPANEEKNAHKNSGKMIGYLERFIVFFLLLNGGFSSIGFVITAKAVIRFPEIGKAKDVRGEAEYYLIGTLLSVSFSFAVTMLLGSLRSIIVNISEFKPLEVSYRRLQKIRFPGVA